MNIVRTASCAATFFALAVTFGVNAQDGTCGNKNHYILDYAVTTWIATGNLNVPRGGHTATLLPDGRVLVAGGGSQGPTWVVLDSAELYDPATGIWSPTGSLTQPRVGHTATLLASGKVLVVGGGSFNELMGTAELYDPATGRWTPTGSLNTPRAAFTATLLATGEVLVAGGVDESDATLLSAELYDPATETWSFTGDLIAGHLLHTATPLQDGRVLVAGGWADDWFQMAASSVDLYDPITGTWSSGARLNLGRAWHTATTLPGGEVLVVGGGRTNLVPARGGGYWHVGVTVDQGELFDPITGAWEIVGNLNEAREQHTATLLPDGKILVAGGYDYNVQRSVTSAEVYDAASATWTNSRSLVYPRSGHTATLLADGTVLVVGGGGPAGSAELYVAPVSSDCQ
jgi:hypothetical protein